MYQVVDFKYVWFIASYKSCLKKRKETEERDRDRERVSVLPLQTEMPHSKAGSLPFSDESVGMRWRKDWHGTLKAWSWACLCHSQSTMLGISLTSIGSNFPFITGNIDPRLPNLSFDWKIT